MFAGLLMTVLPQTFAATCDKVPLLFLVPWYQYLNVVSDTPTGGCRVTNFDAMSTGGGGVTQKTVLGGHSPFLLIGLAILEDLIRLAAIVAVGYIIYGGIQYTTSQGAPDVTKKAQTTIISALVGVVIAIVAASGIEYIGHRLGT